MSRISNKPVAIPSGITITIKGQHLEVKGAKATLQREIHPRVEIKHEDNIIKCAAKDGSKFADMQSGTVRALINNMVKGVQEGFERKLELQGVGYRAQVQGKTLKLTLGYSHPIEYPVPEGITIETPSNTEIMVKGADKQRVGQVAAEIRAYRSPEPYKGKGVRYANEQIILKEAKKK